MHEWYPDARVIERLQGVGRIATAGGFEPVTIRP